MTYALSTTDRLKLTAAMHNAQTAFRGARATGLPLRLDYINELLPSIDAALSLLAGLAKVQDWIPVSERLPEMGEAVLVYGPPDFGQRIDELSDDTEGVHWELCESNAVGDLVTHWRPLLTPPPLPASAAMKEHPPT